MKLSQKNRIEWNRKIVHWKLSNKYIWVFFGFFFVLKSQLIFFLFILEMDMDDVGEKLTVSNHQPTDIIFQILFSFFFPFSVKTRLAYQQKMILDSMNLDGCLSAIPLFMFSFSKKKEKNQIVLGHKNCFSFFFVVVVVVIFIISFFFCWFFYFSVDLVCSKRLYWVGHRIGFSL